MTRFKGWSLSATGGKDEVEKVMPKTGEPVLIDENPKCPKCGGTLTREDSKKNTIRIAFLCNDCRYRFKSKKHLIDRAYSIKLHPDKANPPWIFEAMKPVFEELAAQEGIKLNSKEERHKLAYQLIRQERTEWIIGEPISQQKLRDQIDESIKKHVPEDAIKEILRHLLYASMHYDNPYWDKFIAACEKGNEAIETNLKPTGGKSLVRKQIKPLSPKS